MQKKIVHMSDITIEESAAQTTLYPYHRNNLIVLFVYGTDIRRQFWNSELRFELLRNGDDLFDGLIILIAAALCFMRRWLRLPHDGYVSSYIDVLIIFFGGGRFRMHHRLEGWFFVIITIASVFLVSLWVNIALFASLEIPIESAITFEELANLNSPIYLSPLLGESYEVIQNILRSNFIFFFVFFISKS